MTRREEIANEATKASAEYRFGQFYSYNNDIYSGFIQGAEWADNNSKSPWIKFTEKFPPRQELIIIAMKNKNKEDGIWIYDLCKFFGGDYTDNNNWEEKVNWEIPIYWMPIPNLLEE